MRSRGIDPPHAAPPRPLAPPCLPHRGRLPPVTIGPPRSESHRWRMNPEKNSRLTSCTHRGVIPLRPSHDPDVLHPGKVFSSGQWRTPESVERHRNKVYPCNNPAIPRPGKVFYGGYWRTAESVELARDRNRQRQALGQKNYRVYRQHMADACERCGFVPVVSAQLDVHHRDGDHANNVPENLETVCANCHRLEHAPLQRAKAAA